MKEAIAGLLAVLNQSEDAWDKMSDTIDNSTSSVQFFNENMSLVGKKGKEATKYIEQLKEIFGECEERATELGLSSNDLALSLSLLGNDGTVTAKSMNDLLDVFESMNVSVGKNEKLWRTIGNAEKNNINTGYDYNATLLAIDSSITGLSQSQKEKIKSQLKENMTYEKANKILKEYGLNAERIDLSTLSTSEKIDYLRDSLKGCTEEEIKATLAKLGLSESFNEVNEILKMSDKDYKQYLKNMQTVEGMSEKLAKAMDVTTKGSLLNLASAIENVAISAFEKLKPAIKNTSDALYDFFDVWHNGDKNTFTLEGLEKAFTGLEEKVRSAMPNISKAIVDGIGGINSFINGGSLDSLLQIGTDIVTSICNGIITAYDNGTLTSAISGFITKICDWIIENGPAVQKAGGDILDAVNTGISQNSSKISQAFDVMYGVINTWVSKKQKAIGQLGATIAWAVIKGMIVGIGQGIGNWFSTINAFLSNTLTGIVRSIPGFVEAGFNIVMGIINGIGNGMGNAVNAIMGIGDTIVQAFCDLFGIHSPSTLFSGYGLNIIEGLVNGLLDNIGSVTKAIGDIANAVIDGFKDIWDKIFGKKDKDAELLNIDTKKIKEAQKALNSLSSTVTTVTSTIRNSFTSMTNIIRNQCVSMANIVRNQFTSISNIISNQCQNARNLATSSFISLYKVISTQVSQARDIVSTKFISIASVVNTQSWKARNTGTSAFISLAKVIKTQMMNAYSSVSTYMNKIAAATNVTLSAKVNVSKTITTTEVTVPSTNSLYSVNDLATASTLASTLDLSRSTLSSSNNSIGQAFSGIKQNANQTIEVPVYLDGRQIAKASAKYINGELKAISDRETRKSGRK